MTYNISKCKYQVFKCNKQFLWKENLTRKLWEKLLKPHDSTDKKVFIILCYNSPTFNANLQKQSI